MRLMAGLIKTSAGTVILNGKPIFEYSRTEAARLIAHVPQKTEIAFGMTVLSYVLMGRTPFWSPLANESRRDAEIAFSALENVGLTGLADRDADTLSGGEMQRAMIAKALCQTTDILLLDEPVASLDIAHSLDIMKLLRRLADREDKTIVVVMHDLTLASHFADDLLVMQTGRLALSGKADAVIRDDRISAIYQTKLKIIQDEGVSYILPILPVHGTKEIIM